MALWVSRSKAIDTGTEGSGFMRANARKFKKFSQFTHRNTCKQIHVKITSPRHG